MIVTSHYIVIKNLIHVFGEILDGYVAGPSRAIAIHTASRTLYKKKVVHSPKWFHFKSRVLPCFIFNYPRKNQQNIDQVALVFPNQKHDGWGVPPWSLGFTSARSMTFSRRLGIWKVNQRCDKDQCLVKVSVRR